MLSKGVFVLIPISKKCVKSLSLTYFIDHITYSDGELEEVINQLVQDPELKIDLSVEANVYIGRDTR